MITVGVNIIAVFIIENTMMVLLYIVLYINDMSIALKDMSKVNKLKAQLKNEFEMKDLGAKKILE